MINPAVDGLAEHVGTAAACALLGRSRASHYRAKNPPPPRPRTPRPAPANKLSAAERAHVLAVLTSQRFADKSVAQVWATLLDEGTYLCSMSTMHRILREHDMAGERRRQASHPPRTRPELVATAPGQVWSWDITKLKGPERGVYYDLYVVLDIFSRFVVGWTIAAREDAEIAKNLLEHAMGIHGVPEAIHADRGTSMTSKPVAQLLVDLGVARSHSRPHVSNDNPYSEAAFKTLKYAPVFPERFGSLADAGAFAEQFFAYYNHEHRHCGIGLHTPASVHFGTDVNNARLIEFAQRAFTDIGDVCGDFLRAKLGISGDAGQLLNVDRGKPILLNNALRDEDRILKVVAVPGHERDAHVLAQRQLTQINRGSIGKDVAAGHHIARLHNGALVNTGVLVRTLILGQVINIDRRVIDADFLGINPHHDAARIDRVDHPASQRDLTDPGV